MRSIIQKFVTLKLKRARTPLFRHLKETLGSTDTESYI